MGMGRVPDVGTTLKWKSEKVKKWKIQLTNFRYVFFAMRSIHPAFFQLQSNCLLDL